MMSIDILDEIQQETTHDRPLTSRAVLLQTRSISFDAANQSETAGKILINYASRIYVSWDCA
jgi:hypothetical protein